MWLKWLPWRYVVSKVARSQGFLDPMVLLSRMHGFAQPSEVNAPVELLRAGVVFHARGLINSRAIQHNLDWVWPYWVERQFDPNDEAFVPRAFSITHVNLTHRNWTAVGLPTIDWYPLVDPRGLVTPHFDGWSIDLWIAPEEGVPLLPSRCPDATQHLLTDDRLAVETTVEGHGGHLRSLVDVIWENGEAICRIDVAARHRQPAWLAVAVRPANAEGVSFIREIGFRGAGTLVVRGDQLVKLSRPPERVCMSDYRRGDVFQDIGFHRVAESSPTRRVECEVGMATAAALYRLEPAQPLELSIRIPRESEGAAQTNPSDGQRITPTPCSWRELLHDGCSLQTPDRQFDRLFQAAVRSVLLHTVTDVFPGPYTYRRFWFRDAAFILQSLLALGYCDRVEQHMRKFPERQTRGGYFHSQDGEWDANGQVIWLMNRWSKVTRRALPAALVESVIKGAQWIRDKRTNANSGKLHAGLMPAGFSAEHLGPNDYYYWDDFWSVAGLQNAAELLRDAGRRKEAEQCGQEAASLLRCIDWSVEQTASHRDRRGVPASPYRRMDSGAIGSLAGGYPLQLWDAQDTRLLDTVNFLLGACTVRGGFFQDMIHSGVNAYLTLHLAQILLRAGDPRYLTLMRAVAELASPTGQWPEAIHPRTAGGCMGDGQHVWASAEWIMMIRNCFVREEGERLVLLQGVPPHWLAGGEPLRFGPTPTTYGPVTIEWNPKERPDVRCVADWHDGQPEIEVAQGYACDVVEC